MAGGLTEREILSQYPDLEPEDIRECLRFAAASATDEAVLARARVEERIVVAADTDFGRLLAIQEAAGPSFILFRDPNLLVARDYPNALVPALPVLETDLLAGWVATLRNGRLRVRRLPFFG